MDAAVVSDTSRSAGAVRVGRIIVVRHGKPALDRDAGPRLHWRDYRDWWARYEAGSLLDGQSCPDDLLRHAEGAGRDVIIFASGRPRAQETAAMIARGRTVRHLDIFNEAPLPPPRWSEKKKYLPKTWNKIARFVWLFGHHDGDEHVDETRRRAAAAADVLIAAAEEGADVVLAAHGWFNRMLRRPLARKGWKCVRDGGDSYWSYRIYERAR